MERNQEKTCQGEPPVTAVKPAHPAPRGYVPFGKALYWAMENQLPDAALLYPSFLRMGHTSPAPYAAAFWQFLQSQDEALWVMVDGKVYVAEPAAQKIYCDGDLRQKLIRFRLGD